MSLAFAVLPVLFLLSAFFSGSETVLFSLTAQQRARIRARNPAADARIGRCLADQAVLFSTLLVGNTFVNFAIASLGYRLFLSVWPGLSWLSVPVMTVLLLLFGEITPKRLALVHAERIAPLCSRLLLFWRWLLTPFNRILGYSSKAFAPALTRERRALSDAEFLSILETAAEHGEVSSADADMIEGVLRLSDLCANDEMTPRVDMTTYDVDLDEATRLRRLAESPYRYLPVIRRSPDNVEGVIDRDTRAVGEAMFVPETATLDDVLVSFAKSGRHLAIVLDEYGGTAGLITVNDILEIVMGPAVFGRGGLEPSIVQKESNVWEIDARASLDEINRALDLELEAEDADRLSGWMQFHAERIPHLGQAIEADGCRATVLKRRKRRVTLVRLEILSRPTAETDDEELIAETDEAIERTEEDDR